MFKNTDSTLTIYYKRNTPSSQYWSQTEIDISKCIDGIKCSTIVEGRLFYSDAWFTKLFAQNKSFCDLVFHLNNYKNTYLQLSFVIQL